MKPCNMPGRKRARRERAAAVARGERFTADMQIEDGRVVRAFRAKPNDIRMRVGRAHRDAEGRIVSAPDGFPKQHHPTNHPTSRRPGGRYLCGTLRVIERRV